MRTAWVFLWISVGLLVGTQITRLTRRGSPGRVARTEETTPSDLAASRRSPRAGAGTYQPNNSDAPRHLVEPSSSTRFDCGGLGKLVVESTTDDIDCHVRYVDFFGREETLQVDITDGIGAAVVVPGEYELKWIGSADVAWRILGVRIAANRTTTVRAVDLARAPYVSIPSGYGAAWIRVRTLAGTGAADPMGLYVEGVDVDGTHQEGFEVNAVGERRLILRAGSYRVLAGARTCAFDVIAGETVHVPVESRQHGELVVELSTHRGYQLAAANVALPFAMCVLVEDAGHRYLFLDPGIYTVLWGPGKFRLGQAEVRTNQVTSARFEVPAARIVLRFLGKMRGQLDVVFGLRGGPRGFIGPRHGRWREDVLIETDGTDYAITGLHPGTYQLTLGGDIPTRTLTLDASTAPRTVRVLIE